MQVPLYGLGIILTGLLQAHRRFLAAALAPLASSIVVLVSYLWYGSIVDGQTAPVARQRRGDPGARLGHHARRRRAVGAARRAGDAHRLALAARAADAGATTPAGSAPSPGPASSPCSPSRRPSLATMWLVEAVGRQRHLPRLPVRPGRLPPAVRRARRAGRDERLPGPGRPHRRGGGRHRTPSRGRCVRCSCSPALSVGVLIAAAPAIGAFFSLLDARRGDGAASTVGPRRAARDAHGLRPGPRRVRPHRPADPGPLRARPADRRRARRRPRVEPRRAAAARRSLGGGPGPGGDPALRWASRRRSGMTVSGVALVLLVRRTWGPEATRGAGRTTGALVVAAAARRRRR